ncbi:MAG: hypothetical protein US50_C0016G0024 [Candidatus Nomurabacteria bacterium GW2011_GWB1_37_5]|uniref:Haem-binding uptake Tiki superfamily ChaN domain-containing protein n=1 Tax=Candidatus Nomurabacteria bacterium GW2011_GWB1_37_5 TaxID=1618742 RepID=A0A0G0JF54_9BACT|nr:MAG: hypothetical protein US50_C0016G0024 [Candidatus Nomurabacteria bacterium GW2011_GWB1_37_5]
MINEKADNKIDNLQIDKKEIIVLAENRHGLHDDVILTFLDKYLNFLDGVLLELPIDFQDSINTYVNSGKIDDKLERYFNGAEREGKNIRGLLKIIDKVKKANKTLACIDSSKVQTSQYYTPSKHGYYFLKGESRNEDMFENINWYLNEKPGKYLIIAGAKHVEKGKHFRSGDDTLGARLENKYRGRYVAIFL